MSDFDRAPQDKTPSRMVGVGIQGSHLDGVPDVDGLVNGYLVEAHVHHPDQVVARHVVLHVV